MDLRLIPFLGLIAFFAFAICSCETNSTVAFPTAHTVAARAGERPIADVATLERGRKIYTTRCTDCHVARPIEP